ncbi:MAG: ABC transporter ATP-binding protein/permease [Clostridia bacterium]|nr:ABC transporter ATP-binding protein/permease [Clostridia bacterium]
MLKLVNIKKDYKVANTKVHALKGVNLCFRENEFVGILGQSGCGKTTMLNIIGGLDHYTEGDLVIEGKSTKHFSDRDWDVYRNHRIGFIFQSYNLIPHQTVLGNVELALNIAGVSREERIARAKEALERVGLGNEINKRPNQLSGGQMQRVAIARALVNNPTILLADEPTGALDSKTSVEVMELIREIAGERLVIMVTHNPELAEEYATRIVRLKDGEIESDSNPYSEEEEEKERLEGKTVSESENTEKGTQAVTDETAPVEEASKKKEKKKKKPRAKMGVLSALALSFRNLLTKKGRTILTSIGGSIGIISVCLVLALSNGFNHYIKKTEEDMLSYYPVQVQERAFDMNSIMTSFTAPKDMPDMSEIDDKIYIDSFLTGLAGGMTVTNKVSDQYVDYIGKMDKNWYAEIQYGYGAGLSANLFTTAQTGDVDFPNEEGEFEHIEPTTQYLSLSKLKEFYIAELNRYASQYRNLVGFADMFGNIVNKMPGTKDFNDEKYAKYVLSQYDILGGEDAHFPTNENEAVLVMAADGSINDLTFAQLGLLEEKKFLNLFDQGKDKEETKDSNDKKFTDDNFVTFEKVFNQGYTLFFNNAVYERDLMESQGYPFNYKGSRVDGITAQEGEGINLKITAILRLKEGLSYGCLRNGLNITEAAVDHYVKENSSDDCEIVQWIKNESNLKDFLAQLPSNAIQLGMNLYRMPCNLKVFENYYFSIAELQEALKSYGVTFPPEVMNILSKYRVAYDINSVVRYLGGNTSYNSVSIYANDFDGKEKLLDYLDEWNEMCDRGETYKLEGHDDLVLGEEDKITYSDTVGMLMSMMQTMLNAITYVLVAFTGISLVVSSVMIGIITYVSVVERVKEIGVLRSLGARKQDIRNLFNAETFMIGLSAGIIGVVVSYLLSFLINAILNPLTGIAGLASLNPVAALVMICISVVLTLISGLIPASAAAKKDPVIALRTE